MNKGIVSLNLNRFMNWKMLVFFAFYGMFGFLTKIAALNGKLNFFEYIAETLCNQHNIVYFVIPIYFLAVFNLLTEVSEFTLVRLCKFKNYFISKCSSYFIISLLTVLGILFLLLIMGLGLPFKNEYGITLEYADRYIGPAFDYIFTTPLHLIAVQTFHMILGLTFMSIVAEAIFIFAHNKGVLLLVLATSYIFTVFSASGKSGESFFLMNTYVTLSNKPNFLTKSVLIEIFVTIILYLVVSKYWNKKIYGLKNLIALFFNNWNIKSLISKKFIYISTLLLVITNAALYALTNVTSLSDYIYLQFFGYGLGYLNIIPFTASIISMCTPLLFQSYFLQEQLQNNSCFVGIRYESRLAYLKHLLMTFLSFTTIYVILLGSVALIGGGVIGFKSGIILSAGNYNAGLTDFLSLVFKSLVLKWLEIYMLLLSSLSIYIYTKKVGLSFFVPVIGYIINIFDFGFNKFNPFGSSSISRWGVPSGYNVSFLFTLIILCIVNIFLVIFLIYKGPKRII